MTPAQTTALLSMASDWRSRAALIRDKHKDNPAMVNPSAAGAQALEIAAGELEEWVAGERKP